MIRIPAGIRHFLLSKTVQTGTGAHPPFYSMGPGFLSGDKAAYLHLVPRLRISGTIIQPPVYVRVISCYLWVDTLRIVSDKNCIRHASWLRW